MTPAMADAATELEVRAAFPEALDILARPARYKVLYGGRGGAKSWGIARALLLRAVEAQIRVLCARETQRSINDSVHKLLSNQIEELGLGDYFDIQKATILGYNGSEFIFAGLRHNIHNLKSLEAVDIVWVEEAHSVSKTSWDVLIPTIRKDNSEIWVSFNPVLETDDTWRRFILTPPPGALVRKTTWRDNPWFPEVLRLEMEHLKATDPDAYNHVWEGCCVAFLESAVYKKELREADAAGRFTRVPYDSMVPVQTWWDLGIGDSTSIWFTQQVGYEYHVIDFIESSGEALSYYQQELQRRPYVYLRHNLPHDAKARNLATGKSIEELMRAAGWPVYVVPSIGLVDGINAVRQTFPKCFFDAEKCADGIQALRHYQWPAEGAQGQEKREPLHNWASHAADAFRTFAVGMKTVTTKPKPVVRRTYYGPWS